MKNLLLFLIGAFFIAGFISAGVIKTPGPHTIFDGDTLRTDSTFTDSNFLYTKDLNTVHVWIKTTNPADSTKYRVYYYQGFTQEDIFAVPVDTSGTASGNAITHVADTLWYYTSFETTAPYTQIKVTADGTDHGNRARVWLDVFLTE